MNHILQVIFECKANRNYRIFLISGLLLICFTAWTVLVLTKIVTNVFGITLATLFFLLLTSPITAVVGDRTTIVRQILTIIFIGAIWYIVAIIISQLTSLILAGLLASVIVFVLVITTPIWLVEVEPGRYYLHRKYYDNPYKFQFLGNPLNIIPTNRIDTDEKHDSMIISTMVEQAVKSYAPEILGQTADFIEAWCWIAPLDELHFFWDSRFIEIHTQYTDITTAEGYVFDLNVKFSVAFEPDKLSAEPLMLSLPKFQSMQDIEDLFRQILTNAVEQLIRQHFVSIPYRHAVGAGSIKEFAQQLPELIGWAKSFLGLTIIPYLTNIYPEVSSIAREAADRAAASPHNTIADQARQRDLVNQALHGNVPAQFVLYSQMVSNDVNFCYAPSKDNMPTISQADRLLYALQSGNRNDALSILNLSYEDRVNHVSLPKTQNRLYISDSVSESHTDESPSPHRRGFRYDELDK